MTTTTNILHVQLVLEYNTARSNSAFSGAAMFLAPLAAADMLLVA